MRIQTPTYQLNEDELYVEGYGTEDRPGAPALPVWNTVVELPPTGEWEAVYKSLNTEQVWLSFSMRSVPRVEPSFNVINFV